MNSERSMNLFVDMPPKYQSFVLRMWAENQSNEKGATWRFVLEHPETKARYGFSNLDSLLQFLERRTTL